jgi:cytochrome b subunit of formate dehydrogenase
MITEVERDEGVKLEESFRERLKGELVGKVRQHLEIKRREEEVRKKKEAKSREEYFQRFGLNFRMQHLTLAIGVIILIITGLPIKFHDTTVARMFFGLTGGIAVSRVIHRVGATILIFVSIWHILYITMTKSGRREFKLLLPTKKDFKDFLQNIKYFVGLTKEKPRFGRFSYVEKFDYWAVYWGMVIMICSGLLLWFNNFFLGIVPKFVLDVATEVHSDEAMLATLAIVVWHWYNVHFNPEVFPFNATIFTGKISKSRMLKDHPLEYEQIRSRGDENCVEGKSE